MKRCPNPMPSESEIEIRQIFEPGDFLPSELQTEEARLRAESGRLALQDR